MRKAAALALLLGIVWLDAAQAERPARCIGAFTIKARPITVTLDNLRRAASGECGQRIRIGALVNDSLSPADLARYGWRVVARVGDIATLEGCAASAPYISALPGIRYVKMPSRIHALMDSVRRQTNVNQVLHTQPGWNGPRLTGKKVLFGIIDTDFDTHHKAFLDSNGLTRFLALWDQVDTMKGFPNRFGYGVIKNRSQLLYDSTFGLARGFHGTCMASYAAGSDLQTPYYGVAPDVSIAAVKMGETDQDIIDGLNWLFSLADSLHLPCVVNLSLGVPEGPHDGTSLVDRAIDTLSAKPGHIVVGAAGNTGDKMAHVTFQVGQNQSAGTWMDADTAAGRRYSGIEMWGEAGKTFTDTFYLLDTMTMTYRKSPVQFSTTATRLYNPDTVFWTDSNTHKVDTAVLYVLTERADTLNSKPHLQAVMISKSARLFFGTTVTVAGTTGGTVQGWHLYEKAFKSFGITGFLNGDGAMSVNELGGTAKRIITVGAYSSKRQVTLVTGEVIGAGDTAGHTLTGYSSHGPTVDGRIKPDITAPGSIVVGALARDITNASIVLWPDSPSVGGRYAETGGTSVSSPIVAGVVALMLQADSVLTWDRARQLIQQTALTDIFTGTITTPNNNWGAGKVNALGAVSSLLKISATGHVVPVKEQEHYGLARLSGNRLRFSGAALPKVAKVFLEYFSIAGRCCLRHSIADAVRTDSYNALPRGVYIARVRMDRTVLCSLPISIVDREEVK